jgi:membrane-associated phospholipid phosphatase
MKSLITNFFIHTYHLFSKRYLWVHGMAILGTYVIVVSGFDWWYFVTVHDNVLYAYLRPALGLGMLVPLLMPMAALIVGAIIKKEKLVSTGFTLLESVILGWLLSAFYKAFTGRIQPPHSLLIDTSHQWNFGFMQHGIFWGWPSSHTTVAFATMVALYCMVPKKYKWVGIIGLLYALYVGIAVSFQIHWFSEFFAGAFFGSLVGYVVSRKSNK